MGAAHLRLVQVSRHQNGLLDHLLDNGEDLPGRLLQARANQLQRRERTHCGMGAATGRPPPIGPLRRDKKSRHKVRTERDALGLDPRDWTHNAAAWRQRPRPLGYGSPCGPPLGSFDAAVCSTCWCCNPTSQTPSGPSGCLGLGNPNGLRGGWRFAQGKTRRGDIRTGLISHKSGIWHAKIRALSPPPWKLCP